MRNRKKSYKSRIILLALVLLGVMAYSVYRMGANNQAEIEHTEKKEVLIVGVSPDYPPFEYVENGEIIGFDIDLAKLIAEKLDVEVKIEDMEFASLIPALQNGRIDLILSAMTGTAERAKSVDFTNAYYNGQLDLVLLKTSDQQKVRAFEGMKIGVQLGTTIEVYAKEQQNAIPSMNIISLTFVPQIIEELKLGRIDGMIVDREISKAIIAKNEVLTSVPLEDFEGGNVIVLPKDSSLTEKLNIVIDELRADGQIDMLVQKWFKQE